MSTKKIFNINILKNISVFNNAINKLLFVILLLPIMLFLTSFVISFENANASTSLGQSIEQFQENLQSTIESADNDNNINSNDCNNNISIQSQTNENGKTTSTTKSICDDGSTTTTSMNDNTASTSDNLNGTIVSSEYNQDDGVIINSLFGNWSLTTKDNESKDLNATFIKQPIYYNISSNTFSENSVTTSNTTQPINTESRNDNATSYHLSNFVVTSVQQQNDDISYSGSIDVIQEIRSNNATISDETNNFKGVSLSVSVIDNKVLFINFGNQTPLSKEFTNIPIVGLVR